MSVKGKQTCHIQRWENNHLASLFGFAYRSALFDNKGLHMPCLFLYGCTHWHSNIPTYNAYLRVSKIICQFFTSHISVFTLASINTFYMYIISTFSYCTDPCEYNYHHLLCFEWVVHVITRTSEWVITLWRSCELFCVGIFHESAGRVKYPYQKQWTWFPQMITTNLFLFLCHASILIWCWCQCFISKFKEFTVEKAIT